MKDTVGFETTAIIDIDEQIRKREEALKEEELLNTIKMEPILERTVIEEEEHVTKKKKMMRVTDYMLLSLIVTISSVFIYVIFTVR
ncbi:unknown [Clostridium sp. CAG:1000]|jgi:hypothetical protein|nr:hypothetical protein [Clostridium sp.]CCX36168.1 unknown [Clostridium sp. CAG:1000]